MYAIVYHCTDHQPHPPIAFFDPRPTQQDFCTLRDKYLAPLKAAGGHTMRFWLFVEGSGGIPSWSSDGGNHVVVNGTDAAGTLAEDMRKYLKVAASMDVLIIWTLWNGAASKTRPWQPTR